MSGGSDAATGLDWDEVVEQLSGRERDSLSAQEFDLLADGLFWTDRLQESVEARRAAHSASLHAGDRTGAARAAWRLFYEHWLVGETTVGRGWLEQARSLAAEVADDVSGWIAVADADVAMAEARLRDARMHGTRAVEVATRQPDRNLLAMALQAAGRAEVMSGDQDAGLAKLDQAMIHVIGNELDDHYAGWVYCNVIATCHGIADLRRASEWSESALRWCDGLRSGHLYPGLCRVYSAELAALRGDWTEADHAARRACEELLAHDERYAGAAHYVVGEIARLRGSHEEAEDFFRRAHRLGYAPQPGVALLSFARGDGAGAVRALRSALLPGPAAPLQRSQLVAALADVAVAVDDDEAIRLAHDEMREIDRRSGSLVVGALAESLYGWVDAWKGADETALRHMRTALEAFGRLRLPYEAARERWRIGLVTMRNGDMVTAGLELDAAREALDTLGAVAEARAVASLLGELDGRSAEVSSPLTDRELDVLHLVAGGHTNRQVAEALFLSPHTVARHLGNIYSKLGVGSRAAAAAWASERGLLHGRGPHRRA